MRRPSRFGARFREAARCSSQTANVDQYAQVRVVRFADGDVHGLENSGTLPFEYLSVTSPPINFDYAYANRGA
jgi:hypothetical protein